MIINGREEGEVVQREELERKNGRLFECNDPTDFGREEKGCKWGKSESCDVARAGGDG